MREIFVLIRFADRKLGVPLSQLEVICGTQKTREGVDDWRCWINTH
jgi:calcium binding protein